MNFKIIQLISCYFLIRTITIMIIILKYQQKMKHIKLNLQIKKKRIIKYVKKFFKIKKKFLYIYNIFNIFNNIIFQLLLSIYIPLVLIKKNNRYLNDNLFQVTIKLNRNGDQRIIIEKFKYIPSSVYVNGIQTILENRTLKSLTNPENTITINFDGLITDCSYMFYNKYYKYRSF